MLDLPWGVRDESAVDIARARKIFDADHFGMKEVKDRLIEFLAVRASTGKLKSPILCLVGPPGVGRASIARSVARPSGGSSPRCRWAASTTEPRSAATAGPTSPRCRGGSCRPSRSASR